MSVGKVRFEQMAPYQGAANCTGTVTPGARAMMAYYLEEYEPIASSMGIYNCRSVRGGSTNSLHGEGRACDLGVPVTNEGHAVMWEFLRRVAPHARRLGIQYVIFDRVQWSDRRSPGGEYYGGTHPHRDHTHMELSWNAANNLTLSTIRAVVGSTGKDYRMFTEHGDNDENLKGEPVEWLQLTLGKLGFQPNGGNDGVYGDATATALHDYWLDKFGKEYHGRRVTAHVMDSLLEDRYGGSGNSTPTSIDGLTKEEQEYLAEFVKQGLSRDANAPAIWHVVDLLRHQREFYARYF